MNKKEPNDILAGMAKLEAFAKTNQYRKVGTLEGYGVLYRTLGKPTLKLIGKVLGRLLRKLALPAAAGFGMWYWLDSVWAGVIAAVVAVMFMVDMKRPAPTTVQSHDLGENPEWVYMNGKVNHPLYGIGAMNFHSEHDDS